MVIGLLTATISIPESRSLKDKRAVLRSLKDRILNHHNVSVAEVGRQDVWQASDLAFVTVAAEKGIVEKRLSELGEILGGALFSCWSAWKPSCYEPWFKPIFACAGRSRHAIVRDKRMVIMNNDWKQELGSFLEEKRKDKKEERRLELESFLRDVAMPAFQELKGELEKHDRVVAIRESPTSTSIKVTNQGEEEISYSLQARTFSDRTVPYPSVRFRERRGVRYVAMEGTFGTGATQSVAVQDVSKADVIRNFLSYYMRHSREG